MINFIELSMKLIPSQVFKFRNRLQDSAKLLPSVFINAAKKSLGIQFELKQDSTGKAASYRLSNGKAY